jgi:hypothetical protein
LGRTGKRTIGKIASVVSLGEAVSLIYRSECEASCPTHKRSGGPMLAVPNRRARPTRTVSVAVQFAKAEIHRNEV